MLETECGGDRRRVFDECLIEERRAGLEAVGHRRPVGLHEQLVGKIRLEVAVERAIHVVEPVGGIPDGAIQRVGMFRRECGEERRGIGVTAIPPKGAIVYERLGCRRGAGAGEQRDAAQRAAGLAAGLAAERGTERPAHDRRHQAPVRRRHVGHHRAGVAAE